MKEHQGRIFSGILIILIGIVFLLGSMDQIDIGDFFSDYWPLFIIFIGIWHLFSNNFQNAGIGLVLIIIGGFFLLAELDVLRWNIWHILWPVLIILVGIWLIFKPKFTGYKGKVPGIKENDLDAFALFSGIKRKVESQAFRGGKATAMFGAVELDFSHAKLEGNQATIEVTAMFGGIDVFVPRDWKVVVDASAILGGVDNKHRQAGEGEIKATLFIKATALFGGIDIKN